MLLAEALVDKWDSSPNLLPLFSSLSFSPFNPIPSGGPNPKPARGLGERCELSLGVGRQTIWCISMSKTPALVATVFVDFL